MESSLDEVSAEIEDLIGTVRTEADQTADDIKNSGDAFVRYLYRLFTDADILFQKLADSSSLPMHLRILSRESITVHQSMKRITFYQGTVKRLQKIVLCLQDSIAFL